MKLTIPALLITALIASPAAFAQGTNYAGTTSKPGASFEKDDSAAPTKRPKKTRNEPQENTPCQAHEFQSPDDGLAGQRRVRVRTRTRRRLNRASLVQICSTRKSAEIAALSFSARLYLAVRLSRARMFSELQF